jgi:DNA adenine methylase
MIEPRVRTGYRILRGTKIHCRDFTEIVEMVSEDDFVFFDPPYPSVRKTGSFKKYHPEGFGFERYKELQQLAFELDRRGAYVMITNANDSNGDLKKEDYFDVPYDEDAMPESFRRIQTEGKRMINSDSTERTGIDKTDIIVTNYSKFDP